MRITQDEAGDFVIHLEAGEIISIEPPEGEKLGVMMSGQHEKEYPEWIYVSVKVT